MSLDEFLNTDSGGGLIPVWCELLADVETPVSAYWKLAHDEPFSFLLESVTGGEHVARYSVLGVRPKLVIRAKNDNVTTLDSGIEKKSKLHENQDPLDLLKSAIPRCKQSESASRFIGGAIGILGYDIVRHFEHLPDKNVDDLECDDLAMMVTDAVVVFDHAKNVLRIYVMAERTTKGYSVACEKVTAYVKRLREPLPNLPSGTYPDQRTDNNSEPGEYCASVQRIKDYIAEGDGIQMVLSQRISTKFEAHPLSAYRALRSLNPSPYMYLLRFGAYDVIGASPELLVSLHDDEAMVRPIAGTRARGATLAEDSVFEKDLLADEKEIAEHVMLVDLGRNDLGRVCEFGSVKVSDFMHIERYSHVMHIVSDVVGKLRKEYDAFDLVRATFPAGTLSGAPKVRAMEIIDELENTRRGVYGGAVGYFGSDGDVDLAIAIRTIFLKDGIAHVQAGAGIVHDSIPEREHQECLQKAQACLSAIDLARKGI